MTELKHTSRGFGYYEFIDVEYHLVRDDDLFERLINIQEQKTDENNNFIGW